MSRLIELVREARKAAGFSQAQLAQRLGMTQDNYNKLETGKRGFSDQMLQKLADVPELGLSYVSLRATKLMDEQPPDVLEALYLEAARRRQEKKK